MYDKTWRCGTDKSICNPGFPGIFGKVLSIYPKAHKADLILGIAYLYAYVDIK